MRLSRCYSTGYDCEVCRQYRDAGGVGDLGVPAAERGSFWTGDPPRFRTSLILSTFLPYLYLSFWAQSAKNGGYVIIKKKALVKFNGGMIPYGQMAPGVSLVYNVSRNGINGAKCLNGNAWG